MATREREKAIKREQNRDKRPTAIAKFIRIPSGKVEIVLNLIRGKKYEEAVAILNNTNKSASPVILKVMNSAASNAENNLNMAKDNLYVAECWVTVGATLKRMMPRARGRADRILKRTCNVRVILDELKKEVKASKPTKEVKSVKSEAKAVKTTKQVPVTESERQLTDTPNAKKPLGEKKATAKPTTKTATAKTPVKKEAK